MNPLLSFSPPPFVVLSLPRSRSAWLAHFLRYGGRSVGHDILVGCRRIEDFTSQLAGPEATLAGSCETGGMLGWQLLRGELPGVRLVTVHRPLGQVVDSLRAQGLEWPGLEDELERREAMLEMAGRGADLRVEYQHLADPLACQRVFELVLDLPFDWQWWGHLDRLNIQVSLPQRVATLQRNFEALEGLKAQVRERLVERRLAWPQLH